MHTLPPYLLVFILDGTIAAAHHDQGGASIDAKTHDSLTPKHQPSCASQTADEAGTAGTANITSTATQEMPGTNGDY
jgi:hypothetical protein